MLKLLKKNPFIIPLSVISVVALIKLLVIYLQGDVGWEADSYFHTLQINTLLTDLPHNLEMGMTSWAKPIYTYGYGLLALMLGGLTLQLIQVGNVIIMAVASWLLYKIILKLTNSVTWSTLAILFFSFSFILFRSSITALTEPMFVLIFVWAHYLLLNERRNLGALILGLSVTVRLEMAAIVPVWIVYFYFLEGRSKQFLLLSFLSILPTAIWNLIGFLMTGRLNYLLARGYAQVDAGFYGYGNPAYYLEGFLRYEPILLVLFGVAIAVIVFSKFKHLKFYNFMIAEFVVFGVFQAILWIYGLFGSAGLLRYFVGVMPLLIIVVFGFLAWLVKKLELNKLQLGTLICVLVMLQIIATGLLYIRNRNEFGLRSRPSIEASLVTAGEWLAENISTDQTVFADHPAVLYYADRDLNGSVFVYPDDMKVEGIYVWSQLWGTDGSLANLQLKADLIENIVDEVYIFQL